jgi:SAM-dependent methyltransferase
LKDYVDFYNNVDRKKEYSTIKKLENHPLNDFIIEHNLTNKKVLEIGSNTGRFQDIVEDYTGIDITESVRKYYHKSYYSIDYKKPYPFKNNNFDFIFSLSVFEHIPNINFALKEMKRILKVGGLIYFQPAWHCRPWIAQGYHIRKYSDFNIFGKIYKFLIPIFNNIVYRAIKIMPLRLFYFILFLFNKKIFKENIIFKKIKPNYEKFWDYDGDACNSLDPFFAILYFKANMFEIINCPSIFKSFFIKNDKLILRKIKDEK